jgi:hypothetical protein
MIISHSSYVIEGTEEELVQRVDIQQFSRGKWLLRLCTVIAFVDAPTQQNFSFTVSCNMCQQMQLSARQTTPHFETTPLALVVFNANDTCVAWNNHTSVLTELTNTCNYLRFYVTPATSARRLPNDNIKFQLHVQLVKLLLS